MTERNDRDSKFAMLSRLQFRLESCWLISSHGFSLVSFVLTYLALASCYHACTQNDHDSLLSFWHGLSSPATLNWITTSDSNSDCCQWEGVACDDSGKVERLWLPQKGLTGPLSASIGNLTNLLQLNLSHNMLHGVIDRELFLSLRNLEVLDLSFNKLSGDFPPIYPALHVLDISSNSFNRNFPTLLQTFRLTAVNVSNNSFSGAIPTNSICSNSSLLTTLDFSHNRFSGTIPNGLGKCFNLVNLQAGNNLLSGPLPREIYTLIFLHEISLPFNELSGMFAEDFIPNFRNLRILELNNNNLSGPIPESIGTLFSLEQLLIHYNHLNGPLPTSLSECTNLITLNLRRNYFAGEISSINFSNLHRLATLDLGNNNFTGRLPASLYSCKSLEALRLATNNLQGEIQPDIINLQLLSYLSLSNKFINLSGALQILKDCKNLTAILLSKNFKGELIPENITINHKVFQSVKVLALADCGLTGRIPPWLANLPQLQALDLSLNQLTGAIPPWLGTLPKLFYLDLSNNFFTGTLPREITQLPTLMSPNNGTTNVDQSNLQLPVFVKTHNRTNGLLYNQVSDLPPAIYLRNNTLNGYIPPEIGRLQILHVLDLSHNNFDGGIPDQLSDLTNLEYLDLSVNHLSGTIPQSLIRLNFLAFFSVAHNNLQGLIPSGGQFNTFPLSSFEGNPNLCGMILQQCNETSQRQIHTKSEATNKKLIVVIILSVCLGGSLVIGGLALSLICNRRVSPKVNEENGYIDADGSSFSNHNSDPKLLADSSLVLLGPAKCRHPEFKDFTIFDILKGTKNFDQANIIGCGGFGLVYKASLPNGSNVAIKRLTGDLGLMEREFKAEVEALSNAQHKNLVSLLAYCVHGGAHMLIYSYLENGSLDYWLHEKTNGASQLDWITRLRIARGASRGLLYLHQICEPHIVHRDIKSSNILLNDEFEAHVGDFGLARLILPHRTHVTTELVGTLGYIPPEYGQAWAATLRGDVYSFGVVMLELLTGRRPVEIFKPKQARELVGWIQQMKLQGKQEHVLDPSLQGNGFERQMMQMLDVACMCVNDNPIKRPTIQEVVVCLEKIGETPAETHISMSNINV